MIDNLTLDQLFGIVFIFCSIGIFLLTLISIIQGRTQAWKLSALIRQKQGKSIYIKENEEPKVFYRGIYFSLLLGIFLGVIGFLMLLGILER